MKNFKTKVKIIGYSNLGESLAAASGRISTQAGSASEILSRSKDEKKNENLIAKVTQSGHNSVIEHAFFHIGFEDVSVFAEQFFIEFRLASFTVKSRRYVDFSNSGYYLPSLNEQKDIDEYNELMTFLFEEYKYFCDAKIPKEDARFLLPYSLHSNFYCTVNGRELLLMLKTLLFGRGSEFKELKDIGEDLLNQLKEISPGLCIDFIKRSEGFNNSLDFSDLLTNSKYNNVNDVNLQKNYSKKNSKNLAEVSLISHTKNADKLISKTALMAVNQIDENLADNIISSDEKRKEIINKLIKSQRPRALEHAVYTFSLKNVSLSTLTHITRHRIQSIDIPQLTNISREKYVLPKTIKENEDLRQRYKSAFEKVQKYYIDAKAKGINENDLVYTLLSGNVLDIVFSMNARELRLFFNLRTCNRAQWEIQDIADDMLRLCRQSSPEIFSSYGPSCFKSKCPEGKMSCGKMAEMQIRYENFDIGNLDIE